MDRTKDCLGTLGNKHDIDYVYLFSGYTIVVMKNGSNEVIDMSLGMIEQELTGQNFVRIHRSYLVNLQRIKEITIKNRQLMIRIRGHELPVSRRRKKQLLTLLGAVN